MLTVNDFEILRRKVLLDGHSQCGAGIGSLAQDGGQGAGSCQSAGLPEGRGHVSIHRDSATGVEASDGGGHLKTLRLPTFVTEYAEAAKQAGEQGESHEAFLEHLAELEVNQRDSVCKVRAPD